MKLFESSFKKKTAIQHIPIIQKEVIEHEQSLEKEYKKEVE